MIESGKVILVMIDGLRADTAMHEMGFLEGMVAHGRARRQNMLCELPSLSRTLYHTIHTGLAPQVHGITSNDIVHVSEHDSLFSLAHAAGLRTAAAAYSWLSELYCHTPFDPVMDREIDDESRTIQHGRFYKDGAFPDTELFRAADMLVRRFEPHYMLAHPMGCDYIGHLHGGESATYKQTVGNLDNLLALTVPGWLERGYQVLVTSDHGMDAEGWHGGTREEVRAIPYYHLGVEEGGPMSEIASQLSVAPTVMKLLGQPIPPSMTAPAL